LGLSDFLFLQIRFVIHQSLFEMAGVQIKLRKINGELIKWVSSADFDLKSKLASVNGAALKWTDDDGIAEEITDQARLFAVVDACPQVVFDVVPTSTASSTQGNVTCAW